MRPDGVLEKSLILATPQDLLPILIDRRLAFLWPQLTAWAGADLTPLRDRMLAASDAAFAKGRMAGEPAAWERAAGGRAGALLNRARLLGAGGRRDAAVALLTDATAGGPDGRPWSRSAHLQMLTAIANTLRGAGRLDRADMLMHEIERLAETRAEVLNLLINHAVLLANMNRYADALAMADRARAAYRSYQDTIGGRIQTVPGSERYFDMARACALKGLGREGEAQAALGAMLAAEEPRSLLQPTSPGVAVRRSAYLCLRDPGNLAVALADSLAAMPLPPELINLVLPEGEASPVERPVLAAARADPRYAAIAGTILRPLPPELAPAARDWSD